MPNSSCNEKKLVHKNIKALQSFLSDIVDWENPHEYYILEYFPPEDYENYKPNVYMLQNIEI